MSVHITQTQLDQFHEEGYLILPAAFNPDEVRRMREESDRILELIINSSLANRRTSGRLDIRKTSSGQQLVRKLQPINDLSLYLTEISNDDRLLQPMRQIMGDEPILMEEKLNCKEPLPKPVPIESRQIDDHFPVHNDWAYYTAQNYPQTIISSAISFDDCTPDSGPLRVWPGSHKNFLEHESTDNGLQVLPGLIDFDGGVDILAPAGSVMFFHVVLVHNSKPNLSKRPRRIMIYSHFPKQANIGFDVRNGPRRMIESAYEWEYQKRKDRGEYRDAFRAPTFD